MKKFDSYQKYIASNFRKYPDAGKQTQLALSYLILKLNGEAGEIAEKYGKLLRDSEGKITKTFIVEMLKELGDVLWYISEIASVLGTSLSTVALMNIRKLTSRKVRGVLGGSGDNR